jgi:HEAT repeat protein
VTEDGALAALLAEPTEEGLVDAIGSFVRADPALALETGVRGVASGDAHERAVAAGVLGVLASLGSVPVDDVAAMLGDEVADDVNAVRRLSPVGGIVTVLLARLQVEDDPTALESIIVALGHARDVRAAGAIAQKADHTDAGVRFAVAWALAALGSGSVVVAALRRLASDADDDVRDWATFGLATGDDREAATTDVLIARAEDADDDTRAEAIYGLARRHDKRAFGLIERELSLPIHGELIEQALAELNGGPAAPRPRPGDRNPPIQ